MEQVNTLVVDKTGTLTEGKPRLVTVRPLSGFSEQDLLRLAGSLERASEHPLAAAIAKGATRARCRAGRRASDFESITGKGVTGRVDGKLVAIGNRAFIEEQGTDSAQHADDAETLRREGQTVMFVAVDGKLAGLLGVADPIKATTR